MSAAGEELFRLAASAERCWCVEIPAASPLFAGHFPGHPILPGIAHLAIVERALGRALAGVRSLKLRRPVDPGDALALATSPADGEGWTRFELRHGAQTVSGGAVATWPFTKGEEGDAAPLEDSVLAATFPAVEALLPHAPPSRLVSDVTAASREDVACAAEIPPLHPLVQDGKAPAFLGIEAAAQAAAALEALHRPAATPGSRIGYLVGIRAARFAVPHLAAGRPLHVTARRQGSAPPLSIYDFAVGEEGGVAVTGTISTFLAGPTRDE